MSPNGVFHFSFLYRYPTSFYAVYSLVFTTFSCEGIIKEIERETNVTYSL